MNVMAPVGIITAMSILLVSVIWPAAGF